MSALIAALVVLVVLAAWLLVRYRPRKVVGAYQRFEFWRRVFGTIVFVAVSWTFLRSGRPELILIALILIFLVAMWIIVDKPNEELV